MEKMENGKRNELLIRWSTEGARIPGAFDPKTGKASITLLASYIGLLLSTASMIGLFFSDKLLVAATTSVVFFIISIVFYEMKNLSKVNLDLKDKKIELEDDSKQEGDKHE